MKSGALSAVAVVLPVVAVGRMPFVELRVCPEQQLFVAGSACPTFDAASGLSSSSGA